MRNAAGFTMMEILMAVALVAIVSAVALPRFIDFRSDARTAVTSDRMASLRAALLKFQSNIGSLPTALSELGAQGTRPAFDPINKTGWNGPYVDITVSNWDKDSWETSYHYAANTRTLRSCGPNKSCGDGDDLLVSF